MDSLSSFSVSVNQALVSKKTIFRAPYSKFSKQIAFFLRDQGYFSSVAVSTTELIITLRYVGATTTIKRLVLVSKPSKAIYFRTTFVKSGVFLVSNSDFSLSLWTSCGVIGGKVLFQIL